MTQWFNYKFTDEDGNKVMVKGKDKMEEVIASKKFKQRLEVTYHFPFHFEDGFPDEPGMQELDVIEYALEREFLKKDNSVMALSFTGANRRVWYIYSADVYGTVAEINRAVDAEDELEIIHEPDEEWMFYKTFHEKK